MKQAFQSATQTAGITRRRIHTGAIPALATLLSLCAWIIPAFAQQSGLAFSHLSQAEGLASNNVTSVVQDRRGFVWFGTSGGLNRFDGYRIVSVKASAKDGKAAVDLPVSGLCVDRSGVLWAGTSDRGLYRYNKRTALMDPFTGDTTAEEKLRIEGIRCVFEDSRGLLWIGTYDGLFTIDGRRSRIIRFSEGAQTGMPIGGGVSCLAQTRDGTVWIGTSREGLLSYAPDTKRFRRYQNNPADPRSLPDDYVTGLGVGRNGTLWVGMRGKICSLDRSLQTFTVHTLPPIVNESFFADNSVVSIQEDSNGLLWLATTGGGLKSLALSTGTFTTHQHTPGNTQSLSHDEVTSIFSDREGIVWLGTAGGGVNYFYNKARAFTPLHTSGSAVQDPNDLRVTCLSEDAMGTIWSATAAGRIRTIDGETGREHDAPLSSQFAEAMRKQFITAILHARNGSLWVGTFTDGLYIHDRAQNSTYHSRYGMSSDQTLGNDYVTCILQTRNGEVLVGTSGGGVSMYDGSGVFLRRLRVDPSNAASLPSNIITCMAEDRRGHVWIGSEDAGVTMLDLKTLMFARPEYGDVKDNPLIRRSITALYQRANGTVAIGTNGGLLEYYPSSRRLAEYNKRSGMADSVIRGIVEDENGSLWVSTANGLSRITPRTAAPKTGKKDAAPSEAVEAEQSAGKAAIRTFRVDDGLQGAEFIRGSALRSSAGLLYFGGVSGMNAFHPDRIRDVVRIPPVVFTEFAISDKPIQPFDSTGYLRGPIHEIDTLTLPYSEKVLSFEFAALSYVRPDKNKYSVLLEGFDHEWRNIDATKRSVTYTNLDDGEYILRVRGCSSDGVWNFDGAAIRLIIKPPWYKTIWAFIGYALCVLGLIIGFDSIQRQRVIRKERAAAQIREAELRATAAEQQAKLVEAQADAAEAKSMALQAENERKELELEKARELETAYRELDESHQHLKSTQEQLIHAEKMASLGQLTAGIAHEIKNPLNFVNNFSALSVDIVTDLEEALERDGAKQVEEIRDDLKPLLDDLKLNVKKINEHGTRADAIVRSMLLHSSGKTGGSRPTDVNALLEESVNLAYHAIRGRSLAFNFEIDRSYDDSVGMVELVPQEVSRVFLNIINNGIYALSERAKAKEEGYAPVLRLSSERIASQVEVRISDNGTGIPEDIRTKIFEPFFTTKPTGEGTGLGLSLSYDIIVKGHNGAMSVESEAGKGTTFVIRLPL